MVAAALLVAAGTGTRFGGGMPKQFLPLLGRPVIRLAAESLAPYVSLVQPVGPAAPIEAALAGLPHLPPVAGGANRQASVLAGLEALAPHAPEVVLVHDAARPIVPSGTVPALLAALAHARGAIPGLAVADTLKRGDGAGTIAATVPREGLFRAQTPQAFRFAELLRLHREAAGSAATDDAALFEAAGLAVALVPGSEDNIKITLPEDSPVPPAPWHPPSFRAPAPALTFTPSPPTAGSCSAASKFRTNRGLAGIPTPMSESTPSATRSTGRSPKATSAAISRLPRQPGRTPNSARFLAHAAGRIAARGGVLGNADVTLVCERPKIAPFAASMQARLAEILGVAPGCVSVKATTTERLGFTGRGEGIAAQAIATILLPITESGS